MDYPLSNFRRSTSDQGAIIQDLVPDRIAGPPPVRKCVNYHTLLLLLTWQLGRKLPQDISTYLVLVLQDLVLCKNNRKIKALTKTFF